MVHISLAAVFIFVTLVSAKALPISNGGRIVGGQDAAEGQFPYQVSMRYLIGDHGCGGSIYNKRWIITAAHCIEGLPAAGLIAVVGLTKLSTGGKTYRAVSKLIHPGWNPELLINDIGLVKLANDIEFNDKVQPIPISSSYVGEEKAVVSGWGTTSYPGSVPDNLQFVDLLTVTNEYCQQQHVSTPLPITETQICSFTKAGEGMCHGDSGGPLVVNGELTGIVSWGMACAVGYPDVFTRVYSFKSWIEENTRE